MFVYCGVQHFHASFLLLPLVCEVKMTDVEWDRLQDPPSTLFKGSVTKLNDTEFLIATDGTNQAKYIPNLLTLQAVSKNISTK